MITGFSWEGACDGVTYPTAAPAAGSVHGLGASAHTHIWINPRENPKYDPDVTRNSSSILPTCVPHRSPEALGRRMASNLTALQVCEEEQSLQRARFGTTGTGSEAGLGPESGVRQYLLKQLH